MNASMITPSSSQLLKSDAISPSLLITTQLLKTQYQTIKQIASARIESSILICDDTNTHMILNCWSISVVSDVEQISDLTSYYWWPDNISHGYKHDLSIERRIVKKDWFSPRWLRQSDYICTLIVHVHQPDPPCHVLGSRRREDSSLETAASGRDSNL